MAAGKSKNLTVRFIADTSKWTKPHGRVRKDIDALTKSEKQTSKAFRGIGNETRKLTTQVGTPTSGLSGSLQRAKGLFGTMIPGGTLIALGGVVAAVAAIGLGLRNLISTGAAAEGAITKLTVLLQGDSARALETYERVIEFAAKTPKTSAQLMQGVLIAQTFGFDAMKKGLLGMEQDILTVATGMAAISGQTVPEAMTALMRADLALLDKYGGTARKAYETASLAGRVGTDAFRRTFISEMAKVPEFMKAAEAESQTLTGLWSTIVDNVQLVSLYLSGVTSPDKMSFWNALKAVIKDVSISVQAFVQDIKPLLFDISALLGSMFMALWNSLKAIFAVMRPVWKLLGGIAYVILKVIIWNLTGAFKMIAGITELVVKVSDWLWNWLDAILGVSAAMERLGEYIDNVQLKLQIAGVFLRKTFEAAIAQAREFINLLPSFFTGIGRRIEGTYESGKSRIKDLLGMGDRPSILTRGATAVSDFLGIGRAPPVATPVGEAAPVPVTNVTNVRNESDSSSRVTNVFQRGGDMPEWMMRNPYDITGRPELAGAM